MSSQNLQKDWGTVIWLILFFPVGIYKLWRSPSFPILAKVTITSLFVAFIYVVKTQSTNQEVVHLSSESERKIALIDSKILEQERSSLERKIRSAKFKDKIDLIVKVHRWNDFYLVSCTVGFDGHCGLFEIFEGKNGVQTYYVNGKAKGLLKNQLEASPNAGSKYNITEALAATK